MEMSITLNKGKINRERQKWKRIHVTKSHFPPTVISRNSIFCPIFYFSISVLVLLESGKSFYICCLSITTIKFRNYGSEGRSHERWGRGNCGGTAPRRCLPVSPTDSVSTGFILAVRRMSSNVSRFFDLTFLRFYLLRCVKVIYVVFSALYVVRETERNPR